MYTTGTYLQFRSHDLTHIRTDTVSSKMSLQSHQVHCAAGTELGGRGKRKLWSISSVLVRGFNIRALTKVKGNHL